MSQWKLWENPPTESQVHNLSMLVQDFIFQLHKINYKSVLFNDMDSFFQYVESNLQSAIENNNLIFAEPYEISRQIHARKLAHRLSLFLFYYEAKHPPLATTVRFEEPIRAVIITRPRATALVCIDMHNKFQF